MKKEIFNNLLNESFYAIPRNSERFRNKIKQYAFKLWKYKETEYEEFLDELELIGLLVRQAQITLGITKCSEEAYKIFNSVGLQDNQILVSPDKIKSFLKNNSPNKLGIYNEHFNDQKRSIEKYIENAESLEEIEEALKVAPLSGWLTKEETILMRKNRIPGQIYGLDFPESIGIKMHAFNN